MSLKWITSFGGPYICISKSRALSWKGNRGLSLHIETSTADRAALSPLFGEAGLTDYSWACAVKGYVGAIPDGEQEILVINDQPSDLAWWTLSDAAGILVKWVGADSSEQIESILSGTRQGSYRDTSLHIVVKNDPLIIFDAARTYDEVDQNKLEIILPAGRYRVSLGEYETEDTILQFIRLTNDLM
jgi:Immunity protein 21